MSDWSLDVGLPMCKSLPTQLKNRHECIERLAFNPSSPNKFLLAGGGFFCVVDLDRPVPLNSDFYPPNHVRRSKYTQISSDTGDVRKKGKKVQKMPQKKGYSNMTICLQYNGMVFLDIVDDDEMVVVEQPWLSVVNSLPDALERKIYGQ
uniref:Uncharacterized protein n=1 Tax=Helicotheca tamesis TaxID=374047 RepID=A0A7S2HKE7_9STRA|mmetsp:Transcript_18866/g.25953  ORF Transcript_18866/g.25953 Transcript_18866/m.25953 type:complete len:149 (+) Transcript_18866:110-556(+)